MVIENLEYPKRTREHAVGDRAVETFKIRLPREWIKNEVKKDYGWDVWLTIAKDEQARENFFAQLKGSDTPNYIENGAKISVSLRVSSVNWLLDMAVPVMLCICDTGHPQEPVYYVWLYEEISRISKENPAWRKQGNIVFHIPVSQTLDKDKIEEIRRYVEKFHSDLKINAAIGDVLGPSLGFKKSIPVSSFTEEAGSIVLERVSSVMAESGIVDIIKEKEERSVKPLSPKDQKRFKEIKESSLALNSFRDRDAHEILDKLAPEIENASEGIKARFYNNMGALALHHGDYEGAGEYFRKAEELRPREPKYVTNSLLAEFLLSLPENDSEPVQFSEGWLGKLNRILEEAPDFSSAIRLKATWLGFTKGAQVAEKYLRSTKAWQEEPVVCLCELTEAYKNEGDWDKGIELLSEAEATGEDLNGTFWGLFGSIYLQKALGIKKRLSSFTVHGPGPSFLDMTSLRKAEQCFLKACKVFNYAGFPLIAQMAVTDLAVVQRLLGKTDEAKHFCKLFLILHPDNAEVAAALAGSLIMTEDDNTLTIRYSRIAHEANPSDKTNYQNYLISLYQAEDYDTLLELVTKRENTGFSDIEEEGRSLALSAVALNEIGEEQKATEKVRAMKKKPEIIEDATVADAIIMRKNGVPDKDVANIYRNTLEDHPDSIVLLTHFIWHLKSSDPEEAKEKAKAIRRIHTLRQLLPIEINELGLCYITLKKYEKAVLIFEQGEKRYPHESRLLYGHARALSELGDEEETYEVLKKYFELGRKDYTVLRNLAYSALETGRLEEAIGIFQKAAMKAEEAEERGQIHCQLWELKRTAGHPPKEVLRHVMLFGKTCGGDVEKEARFLMMAMLTPSPQEVEPELSKWYEEIKKRLKQFSDEHPQFPHFRSFKIPEDIPDEEKGPYILAQMSALMLPTYLAAEPLRMATRSVPYPLVLRASLLPEIHSVFDYWSACVSSKDLSRGIHIWFDFNPFDEELKCLSKREAACVDLNALLSLAELDLLDLLPKHFNLLIFARATKRQIDQELFELKGPHPLAKKLEAWRLEHRKIIRIRSVDEEVDALEEGIGYRQRNGGIFLQVQEPINRLVPCGVGESILLARQLGLSLYSDDSNIRQMAYAEFGVKGFSTIALITQLRKEGHLSLQTETAVFCEMIRKNFRVIPFSKDHLNSRLADLRSVSKAEGRSTPSEDDLISDKEMGALLRQFGDTFFKPEWLAQIAASWWVSLLDVEGLDDETLIVCMQYPAYAMAMRTSGGVLTGIRKHEQEDLLAHVLAFFMLKGYEKRGELVPRAWSVVKSYCERFFSRDITRYEMTLYELLPKWVLREIENMRIPDTEKLDRLIMISSCLPEEDRKKIDATFITLKPSLVGKH